MTRQRSPSIAQDWIAHDPDPETAAELSALGDDELRARFARPLTFGTAGLRGPVRGGPDAMNLAVVLRATWAVAQVLKASGAAGLGVVVGRDARHGSESFARAAAEVLAAEGFSVTLLPDPMPTPIVAFAVRHNRAAAGIQLTASHNPATDNGYKVYFTAGRPIVPPTDRQIEEAMAAAPHADEIAREPVESVETDIVARYLERAARVRRTNGSLRVALTPLHGVGGEFILDALGRAGVADVHVVQNQFAPDPDFPTVDSPNPEHPDAVAELLQLAAEVEADIAIALDPDADRCAVGVPEPSGWRMLSGDETGWLLGDYLLSQLDTGPVTDAIVVASTLVSSRMLAAIAEVHGARHVETLTGFKWLVRADDDPPGSTLVYAYEEAIGHCVDPSAVRDKDGISAAVLCCDLVVALNHQGRTLLDALDDLARRFGVHSTTAVGRPVADPGADDALLERLRRNPPARLAGFDLTFTDLRDDAGPLRTDAVILAGGTAATAARIVVRPSGTEPKVKCYIEVRRSCHDDEDLDTARAAAARLRDELADAIRQW